MPSLPQFPGLASSPTSSKVMGDKLTNYQMWSPPHTIVLCTSLAGAALICFWFQLRVLIATFETLPGLGPGCLKDHLFSRASISGTRTRRQEMLWVPSPKEVHLVRPRSLSMVTPFPSPGYPAWRLQANTEPIKWLVWLLPPEWWCMFCVLEYQFCKPLKITASWATIYIFLNK